MKKINTNYLGVIILTLKHVFRSKDLLVIHFFAPWADQCTQINDLVKDLAENIEYSAAKYAKVEAEELAELSLKYEIAAVPTVVLIKDLSVIDRIEGVNPAELAEKIRKHLPNVSDGSTKKEISLEERLKALVNQAPCMLFMKGDPLNPRCGFSRTIVDILNGHNAEYQTFDILSDNTVREGLKKFSNWPTYPQLYVNGELLGGLDIVKEMIESGELQEMLPKKNQ